tara:strand:- start:2383 stop:3930 length:1548 start_codon:yes stop_codon:yes gene_type:complete
VEGVELALKATKYFTKKMTTAQIEAEEKKLKLQLIENLEWEKKYEEDNLIEFFDGSNAELAGYPGANPLQAELLEAWLDPSLKVFTYCGANRIGKTTILCILTISTIIGRFPWQGGAKIHFKHTKPRKIRIIGQDWEKHIKAVLLPDLEKWWPKNRPVKKKKNNMGVDALWTDEKTGGTIEIMSNHQESELHEGWSGDLICYDEPPTRDIRVANARGLIDREGRELFSMTLLKEAWVDREVIKAMDEQGKPDKTVFNVSGPIESNLGFGITQEGINQYAKTLTDDEKKARLMGIPSHMQGLIYSQFKRKIHLKERFPRGVPTDYLIDISIDTHPRENQAILFVATSPDNRKYIVEEIWDHGDGIWIGQEIIKCVKHHTFTVNRVICDPLAKGDENNPNTVFDNIKKVLYAYGYHLETATKDLKSGIIKTKEFLKGPNEEPSLFIFDDLVRTIYEIEGYMWDPKNPGKPLDKDDHMMENLYRILLLDTQWYDSTEDEEGGEDDYEGDQGRSAVGGY